ncbi:helix-turn-helix transcriptional regulator [Streptomyces sp. NBC_00120]|uniref:Helix-turn-helix transcriptional regulator n=1 Tax=Streptomyces sp. NBC_00119 TaxID=2975659 RepID=A0AAU1U2V0_9ACTN|nr:helix-turn-helix transcriptional regulator [Streptomyces sp. NBC_00120]MCX5321756.1 helix-turn-helix transcriptional regulator [Streptomyces sp. NBC_00120]
MPRRLLAIDHTKIRARREQAGLSLQELADRVGVTYRVVAYWEEGRYAPEARNVRRLADALGCATADLTDTPSGSETLVDLRYAAGLTAEEVASRLRATAVGRDLFVDAHKVRSLERNRPVSGWNWRKPGYSGQLVHQLAVVYGVPVRMVVDAWMRTRPADEPPHLPERLSHRPAASAVEGWQELNERQRIYLGEILRDDQMTEAEMWMRRQNQVSVPPARQWRRLPFAFDAPIEVAGRTRLQQRLRTAGVHDQGAGATLHSLERVGMVKVTKDRVEMPGVGEVDQTLVEITRKGRACARAGLGVPADTAPPVHLLSEWLWGVLLRVGGAGPEGLHESELRGKSLFYLAVGYRPKRQAHPSRGFIELRPRFAPGDTHVLEYRWHATDLGERHIAAYQREYAGLYPSLTP